MIVRYAFLSILFFPWIFPWRCLSLQPVNTVNSRFITSLYALQFPSTGTEEPDLSLARRKEANFDRNDSASGTTQEQRRERQQPEEQQIYLFSLNWIQESDPKYFLKKDIRQIWEWKDSVLGDGRDFFVPKPKTLMALQNYLLENIPNLMECSIISNCARLEVLCSYSCSPSFEGDDREGMNNTEKRQEELLSRGITDCLVTQLDHHRNESKNRNPWAKMAMQLPINVDRPEFALTTKQPMVDPMQPDSYYDSWWNVTVGSQSILNHVCKVSAGMGRRPRRPDRPVVFRPFSSRDAHILLQLKRTRENIGVRSVGEDRSNSKNRMEERKKGDYSSSKQQHQKRKILPIILDYALRAGKAARNVNIVPEIEELKEMTSAESSVLSVSEQETSQRVADAAYGKGIHPLIMECVAKLDDSTNNVDGRIAEFRQSAFGFLHEIEIGANDSHDRKIIQQDLRTWLNRRLHEPTTELRSLSRQQNGDKDIDSYFTNTLKEIRNELQKELRRRRELVD